MQDANNKNENVFYLRGSSMIPLIKPGNKLYIQTHNLEKCRPGDIICFFKNSITFFAHRLINYKFDNNKKYAIEKGDNVYGFSLIPYENIFGKVVKIENKKYTLNLCTTKWHIANFILAKIATLQIFLLKIFPYSYHKDSLIKKIPHYIIKLFFKFMSYFFISLFKEKNS